MIIVMLLRRVTSIIVMLLQLFVMSLTVMSLHLDLRIVRNRKLRRLREKGPKYREQNIIDWHLNKRILITAIDDYAKNWSKREGYHVFALEEWSETVKLIIGNRITNLQHRNFGHCHKILEEQHIKTYLTELQSKYVLVPKDKAGNNIIFVCKYYYIRTLGRAWHKFGYES